MKRLSNYKLLENNPFPAMNEDSIKRTAENIKRLPKMLELRPIVVDSNDIIQAGNKRFQALLLLGYKEVPDEWIVSAKNYSKKELKELILLDNVKEGVWDFEILKIDFPKIDLSSFNIEVPELDDLIFVGSDMMGDNSNLNKPARMTTGDGVKIYIGNFATYIKENEDMYKELIELSEMLMNGDISEEILLDSLLKLK